MNLRLEKNSQIITIEDIDFILWKFILASIPLCPFYLIYGISYLFRFINSTIGTKIGSILLGWAEYKE